VVQFRAGTGSRVDKDADIIKVFITCLFCRMLPCYCFIVDIFYPGHRVKCYWVGSGHGSVTLTRFHLWFNFFAAVVEENL